MVRYDHTSTILILSFPCPPLGGKNDFKLVYIKKKEQQLQES